MKFHIAGKFDQELLSWWSGKMWKAKKFSSFRFSSEILEFSQLANRKIEIPPAPHERICVASSNKLFLVPITIFVLFHLWQVLTYFWTSRMSSQTHTRIYLYSIYSLRLSINLGAGKISRECVHYHSLIRAKSSCQLHVPRCSFWSFSRRQRGDYIFSRIRGTLNPARVINFAKIHSG